MDSIHIKGAREHNLKNLELTIPRNKLVVITGVSGSGKSSLAFDTIFAEGQRRYVESLSAYARQFLEQMEKPDVDVIEGLSPAISIEQKTTSKNPRSTVGTITEIYDYLRLLFASVGVPHCVECGQAIRAQTIQQMADHVLELPDGTRFQVMAPFVRGKKGEYRKPLQDLARQGYVRARIDGDMVELSDPPPLDKQKKHSIEIVIDRLVAKPLDEAFRRRLADSLETACRLGEGLAMIVVAAAGGEKAERTGAGTAATEELLSQNYACTQCGFSLGEVTPRLFSFNSPYGACAACGGLGSSLEADPQKIIPDTGLTIDEGAIALWAPGSANWRLRQLQTVARHFGIRTDVAWSKLPKTARQILFEGSGEEEIQFEYVAEKGSYKYRGAYEGLLPMLARRYKESENPRTRTEIERFMSFTPCPSCAGKRLKREALAVKLAGQTIYDLCELPIHSLRGWFTALELAARAQAIADKILKEITDRLAFLDNVGIGYLTLSRSSATLSGGEGQRIRLATQIGSKLMGVLYVLDEPSIGLHQKDNRKLIDTLLGMRDLGNSILVVEHDEETIAAADHVIDLGPGAGVHGGELVAAGTPAQVAANPASLTGRYLSGQLAIEVPAERRRPARGHLRIVGARQHNLKDLTVEIPLGLFTCLTGVSGSGKSTLVNDILYKAAARGLHGAGAVPGEHDRIEGLDEIDKVIDIDQSPIGRTPRSNPATYTNLFTPLRELMAKVPEARMRGYKAGRFSFNVKGGRCEACGGDGQNQIEMHFLPDIYVTCEVCTGKRYNRETLAVHYRGLSIADILDLTVEQALETFSAIPQIENVLATLFQVGLGYIKLGQSATTLSGGEAQRIKLARELAKRSTGRTLYILDEPTTGLHFDDIKKLLEVLQSLAGKGNTVVVIEHNLDVIKTADWIIDLGPDGGDEGGRIVDLGSPEDLARAPRCYTGEYLRRAFAKRKSAGRERSGRQRQGAAAGA